MEKMIELTYNNDASYIFISKICGIRQLTNCSAIYCEGDVTFFSDLTAEEIYYNLRESNKIVALTCEGEVSYVLVSNICGVRQLQDYSAVYCEPNVVFFSDLKAKEVIDIIQKDV